jgi:hypothetical protein
LEIVAGERDGAPVVYRPTLDLRRIGRCASDDPAAATRGTGAAISTDFFFKVIRAFFAFCAELFVGGFLFFFQGFFARFARFAFFARELGLTGGDAAGTPGRCAQDDALEGQRAAFGDGEQPRVAVVFVLKRRQRAVLGDEGDALSGGDFESFGQLAGREFLRLRDRDLRVFEAFEDVRAALFDRFFDRFGRLLRFRSALDRGRFFCDGRADRRRTHTKKRERHRPSRPPPPQAPMHGRIVPEPSVESHCPDGQAQTPEGNVGLQPTRTVLLLTIWLTVSFWTAPSSPVRTR